MSGGVDSSVAALLLKKSGYDCVGVFMRCYNLDGCSERDAEDARRVAEYIGIPFYVFDFEEEYKKRVVEYMVEGYRAGITPNPDVMCNREIKFGLFLERALALGADYVATGHYVRRVPLLRHRLSAHSSGAPQRYALAPARGGDHDQAAVAPRVAAEREPSAFGLREGKDKNKDQSYFLWTLTQAQLQHCLFPIGDYLKSEVREIARKAKLPTAEKKDSQGICFLGNVLLMDFLKQYLPEREGAVVLALSGVEGTTYKKIGEHEGAHFYTIGQRHLKISKFEPQNAKCGNQKPLYVVKKDVTANTLVVAEGSDNPALYKKEVSLTDVHFIRDLPFTSSSLPVLARVRYRQPLAEAELRKLTTKSYKLIFKKPQKFIAPGQSAVFYSVADGDLPAGRQVLGGGIIL